MSRGSEASCRAIHSSVEPQTAQLCGWSDEVAAAGAGRFVLVVGEAGAGKTPLCSEFSRLPTSAAIAWSRCGMGGDGPPLWPWPDLVAELRSQQKVITEPDPAAEPLDRFGLFPAVAEQLRSLCKRRPAIALIDDIHGATRTSCCSPLHRPFAAPLPVAASRHLADRGVPLLGPTTWRSSLRKETSSSSRLHPPETPPAISSSVAAKRSLRRRSWGNWWNAWAGIPCMSPRLCVRR
jgi:hypothetical protein